MIILLVLVIILVLFEIYALLLQCRNGHSALKELRMFRYAHRGFHDKPAIPENSMAAFRRALQNYYGVELDVHLMADGKLAVIHDDSLLRTAGVDVKIEDLTAADLENYRLEGTDEKIPLFRDVLELFEGKTPLIVELKAARGNHAALTKAACELLDKYDVTYCIESFHPGVVAHLKKHYPNVMRGQLSENFMKNPKVRFIPAFPMTYLLSTVLTRPDFIAYAHKDRSCISLKIMRRIYGVHEVGWTIRERDTMAALERDGVTPIFENFIP